MYRIFSLISLIFISFTSVNADVTNVFEFTNSELSKLEVRKVRGADNKTIYSIGSNENGNYLKAVADNVVGILNEDCEPNPKTHYGKSKLMAECYILSKKIARNKRVYILRPCMIHGPNNKGNLNLLYNLVSKRIPWILGSFQNKRSYCSIDNLLFIINELIKNNTIPSGVYNVADDQYLSTNEIISLISNFTFSINPSSKTSATV